MKSKTKYCLKHKDKSVDRYNIKRILKIYYLIFTKYNKLCNAQNSGINFEYDRIKLQHPTFIAILAQEFLVNQGQNLIRRNPRIRVLKIKTVRKIFDMQRFASCFIFNIIFYLYRTIFLQALNYYLFKLSTTGVKFSSKTNALIDRSASLSTVCGTVSVTVPYCVSTVL